MNYAQLCLMLIAGISAGYQFMCAVAEHMP